MKHVFCIGSHTRYLTAMGVINKYKLPYKDVVFVLWRHYECYALPDEIKTYDMSHNMMTPRTATKKQIMIYFEELEGFLNNEIAEEYTLYIAHLANYDWQVMATNKLCVDLKFIQEGIIDFCVGPHYHRRLSLVELLKRFYVDTFFMNFGRSWWPRNWDYYRYGVRHVSETFAISEGLFNKMECKHTIIEWPKTKLPIVLLDDSIYFVFESLCDTGGIERAVYMEATEKMIKKFAGEHNYVKFHPSQKEESKDYIKSLFQKKGFQVEQLPDNVPFEMILASQPHMEVCGFTTSLVFYAALMPQHKAHICVPALYKSRKFANGSYWKNFEANLKRCYGDRFKYEEL